MHMGAGGAARRANVADMLAAAHQVTFAHHQSRRVEERAVEAAAVIDDQQEAFERERTLGGEHHHPVGGRHIGRAALPGRDIEARVIAARFPAAIDALRAEATRYAAPDGPCERLPPAIDIVVLRACGCNPGEFRFRLVAQGSSTVLAERLVTVNAGEKRAVVIERSEDGTYTMQVVIEQ